jgi:hypothetical protein
MTFHAEAFEFHGERGDEVGDGGLNVQRRFHALGSDAGLWRCGASVWDVVEVLGESEL